jgi:predicted nucleic acid-binding protein
MNLESALEGITRILLDTAPVIYLVEKSPVYIGLLKRFLTLREEMSLTLITTPITLAECLIHPQKLGRDDLVTAYRTAIVESANTRFMNLGSEDAIEAGRLRSEYNLPLADAFQAAVAVRSKCNAILTNDRQFARITEVRAILLDDIEP